MGMSWNNSEATAQPLAASKDNEAFAACLAAANEGDPSAYFELGVICSTDDTIVSADLIEAHKWFNLAASLGHEGAAALRAELAEEMCTRDIAEAQRRARQWLTAFVRKAA